MTGKVVFHQNCQKIPCLCHLLRTHIYQHRKSLTPRQDVPMKKNSIAGAGLQKKKKVFPLMEIR